MAGKGPLRRLASKLRGVAAKDVAPRAYRSCWGCSLDRCGQGFDNTCACCRGNHTGIR